LKADAEKLFRTVRGGNFRIGGDFLPVLFFKRAANTLKIGVSPARRFDLSCLPDYIIEQCLQTLF
jgi:hypothetical protein